ncbi:hypothetical protein JKP88DRAFT_174053, partial [Tribonema minus]
MERAGRESVIGAAVRKTAELLRNGSTSTSPDGGNAPRLHFMGEEVDETGKTSLEKATVTLIIKRSHERFLPPGYNKCAVVKKLHLQAVHDSWAAFLAGASPTFRAHVEEDDSGRVMSPVTFFYDLFWARLFTVAPRLRALFGDNMVRQSRCLIRMTCEIAGLLEALAAGRGTAGLEAVAHANIEIGLRAEHYEPLAAVLRHALEFCLGEPAWTPLVAESWMRAIAVFVNASVSVTVAALEDGARQETEAEQ